MPKVAKTCYSHIGGKLGEFILDAYIQKGYLKKNSPNDKFFEITKIGETHFKKMGIDLELLPKE